MQEFLMILVVALIIYTTLLTIGKNKIISDLQERVNKDNWLIWDLEEDNDHLEKKADRYHALRWVTTKMKLRKFDNDYARWKIN